MESERHFLQMTLLIQSLRASYTDRTDLYVGGDMFVYFSELQSKRNDFRGPDVFVVTGVDPHERKSWVVWEEDGRTPDVVIELISESTEKEDRGRKKDIYARQLQVGYYFLYDPFSHVLDGFVLVGGEYQPIVPDDRSRLACPLLNLLLVVTEGTFTGVTTTWLRWARPNGEVLATMDERARDTVVRADEEARRADEESRRADEASRRADEASRRADEASRRADALEAKLRAYEEKLGKV